MGIILSRLIALREFGLIGMVTIFIAISQTFVNSVVAYYLNSYWSGKMVNYPMKEQVGDILPSFLLALVMGVLVYAIGIILQSGNLVKLIIQFISGTILVISGSEITKLSPYLFLKQIVVAKVKSFINARR